MRHCDVVDNVAANGGVAAGRRESILASSCEDSHVVLSCWLVIAFTAVLACRHVDLLFVWKSRDVKSAVGNAARLQTGPFSFWESLLRAIAARNLRGDFA
jgi:hypothetical protein